MPTIQEIAEIAIRYETATSDAMIVACVQRHYATGEPLDMPMRPQHVPPRGKRPVEEVPWERFVKCNRPTRHNHC